MKFEFSSMETLGKEKVVIQRKGMEEACSLRFQRCVPILCKVKITKYQIFCSR